MTRADSFERGATYRARTAFDTALDHFDPSERLVYFRHSLSSYDSMQGWFFYVDGVVGGIRRDPLDGIVVERGSSPRSRGRSVDATARRSTSATRRGRFPRR